MRLGDTQIILGNYICGKLKIEGNYELQGEYLIVWVIEGLMRRNMNI